jgi:hypothetical protein
MPVRRREAPVRYVREEPDHSGRVAVCRFASMARTLTHPEEIFRALNDQPVREL